MKKLSNSSQKSIRTVKMKSIFFCGLILALGLCCQAEDDADAHADAPCGMKEWVQFNNELKVEVCKPETTDDTVLTALLECKSVLSSHMEKIDSYKERAQQMYEKCGVPNEKDIEGYTKVTTDDNKKILMGYCSDNMKPCIRETIKEWKEKGEFKNPEESERPHLTDEEKEQLKTCMKKAVKME